MRRLIAIVVFVAITAYTFWPSLENDFTNWDDIDYVVENDAIKDLNLESIGEMFATTTLGHYHPLTFLSYSIDYYFFGLDAKGFHLSSLLLHLISTCLVFFIILKLFNHFWMAFIVALLFGVHPMHVESICWISDRKGLLAAFFILLAMLNYLEYLKNKQWRFYLLTILFYCFSLLSKATMVVFPIVLILIDYYKLDKFEIKSILNKIPLLLLSFFFGGLALYTQKQAGAVHYMSDFSLFSRILIASESLLIYCYKSVVPINISAFYPYPIIKEGLGIEYYLSLMLLLGLVYILYKYRKNKFIVFSIFFFLLNIILMLQIIPVGKAIMADRYTYISYIGIFLLFTYPLKINKLEKYKKLLIAGYLIFALALVLVARKEVYVWKNSFNLWSKVMINNRKSDLPNLNFGMVYLERGDYENAIKHFSYAIDYFPKYERAYYNRANAKLKINDIEGAIHDYTSAINIAPNFDKAYNNRCLVLSSIGNLDQALMDCNHAIEINPAYAKAYYNRANVWYKRKELEKAILDFTASLSLLEDATAYLLRGNCNYQLRYLDNALSDYSSAINLSTNLASAYYNSALIYIERKDVDKGIFYLKKAIKYHLENGDIANSNEAQSLLNSIQK